MSYEEKSKLQQENSVFLLFACMSKFFLFYGARKGRIFTLHKARSMYFSLCVCLCFGIPPFGGILPIC
jgi:uncharacterized membrane protein